MLLSVDGDRCWRTDDAQVLPASDCRRAARARFQLVDRERIGPFRPLSLREVEVAISELPMLPQQIRQGRADTGLPAHSAEVDGGASSLRDVREDVYFVANMNGHAGVLGENDADIRLRARRYCFVQVPSRADEDATAKFFPPAEWNESSQAPKLGHEPPETPAKHQTSGRPRKFRSVATVRCCAPIVTRCGPSTCTGDA